MKRRALLARTTTLTAAALAGCLSDPVGDGEPPAGGDTSTDIPDDSPTPTDSPTPAEPEFSFELLDVESGQGENDATVSFGDDGEVTVEGTISGRNGCYRARLASAELSVGTLEVRVESFEDKEEDETCTQAIVDIHYRATFEFDGSIPEHVVVEHETNGETQTVADERR